MDTSFQNPSPHYAFIPTAFARNDAGFFNEPAQFTDVINANRPSESVSAFSVGKTVLQAEFGLYGFNETHRIYKYDAKGFGNELSLRYGAFFEQLEIDLDLQYQNEDVTYSDYFGDNTSYLDNNRGLRHTRIGAKYLVYDPMKNYQQKPNLYSWKANHGFKWRSLIPAVGVYAGANINLAGPIFDRPAFPEQNKLSPRVAVLTQNQFGRFVFLTNIIADQPGTNRESIDYVVTVTHGINMRWSAFFELEGFNGTFYHSSVIRGGAAYLPWENVQIDASFGTTMNDAPSKLTVGVGLSWRFDELYQDIFLRLPKDKKEKAKWIRRWKRLRRRKRSERTL